MDGAGAPNYPAAVIGYQKAADKGYSRALIDPGTLYEQGLGVDKDQLKALNLYRQARGLPAVNLMFESAARREQESLRAELEKSVAQIDAQVNALQKQLQRAEAELAKKPPPGQAAAPAQISSAEVESLHSPAARCPCPRAGQAYFRRRFRSALRQRRRPTGAKPRARARFHRKIRMLDLGGR